VAAPAARRRPSWASPGGVRALEPAAWLAFTIGLVLIAAASFLAPARARIDAALWPAPLDDVYIHFGFARSAALGHPFEWIAGNGYSSGATSLTYPLVLAVGWLAGFRGPSLGAFATLVAIAALVDLARSLRALAGPRPRWVAWLVPPLVLAVPVLDWSWFSGMETPLLGAVLGRALVAASRALVAAPPGRARAQLRAGLWLAVLVATRPETIALALPLGLAIVHGARSLGTAASLGRAVAPPLAWLALQAAANRALTGEWGAAGAVRKLVVSSPFESPLEMAGEVLRNLAVLRAQAFELALGGAAFAWIVPALGLAAVLDRRSRRLGVALLTGSALSLVLVCANATARFQNLRYAAPSLAMLLAAAALGLSALARRGRLLGALGAALGLVAVVAPAPEFSRQIRHFARASANIAEQQVRAAEAVRRRGARRVLVNDAGAIPYLSGIPAIDGLGLGGFRGLPFARASVHGVPAVVELLERLPDADRPDLLALYPGWWLGLADLFGRPVESFRIRDNVICGADEKVLYEADWSALGPPGPTRPDAADELDVGDLVSEREHGYVLPSHGGWIAGAVLRLPGGDVRRFDAGRILPEGTRESFVAGPGATLAPASLVLRTDPGPPVRLRVGRERDGRSLGEVDVELPARPEGAWFEHAVPLPDIAPGDRVTIEAREGAWRGFHAWLVRSSRPAGASGCSGAPGP
jgi:hypothetical protein